MPFARGVRCFFLTAVLTCLGVLLIDEAGAENARPNRHRVASDHQHGAFVCGTYHGSALDAILFDKVQRSQHTQQALAPRPAQTFVAGDLVVIEDDGTLIAEPGRNAFDLRNKGLHFTPNTNGSYDVSASTLTFDEGLGTNLNAGDDTNHRINFTAGFSFPFAGQTWDHTYIRSNGNITFGGIGNPDFYDPADFNLELPIIAAFFVDLNPQAGGGVYYQHAADRFVITWDRIPEFGAQNSNTIQLTLFADGSFDIVFTDVDIQVALNGNPIYVGFSIGDLGAEFQSVNFSNLPITGSRAGAIFEAFEDIPYRVVSTVGIAQRFYAVQPDSFDQLVLITDFDLLGAPFGAFYQFVRNDIQGLGLNNFDLTANYGSAGRLQGFLHMNFVNYWPDNPAGFSFVNVLGQEAEHEWGAFVRSLVNGVETDLILGRSLGHWSFYLDTDGSVMEGNGWQDNGNGTFTTVRSFDNFSLLDHYLMGLRPAEEIPPFFLVDVPGVTLTQRSAFPQVGVTATGVKRTITIDDIIAVEGPRVPSAATAPKVFRQGYVYLTRQGVTPSQANLDKADRFRASWIDYYSDRTDGRGIFQTQLGPALPVATVEGLVTNASNGSIIKNVEAKWLEKNYVQPIYDGGHYEFRTLASSTAPADIQATIVLRAFPYLPDTSVVTLTYGNPLVHHRALTPLPQTNLTGAVRDAAGNGVSAKLTLFASSDVIDDFTATATSDAQGNFTFSGLYVSQPPAIAYDRLVVEPDIPFAGQTLTNIVITGGTNDLNIVVEPADILLVNDDPNGNFSNYYSSALAEIGVTSFVWSQKDRGLAPVSFAPQFKRNIIIWYTGNASGAEVLTLAEQDSLAAHLDRGGSVFLTGQNIAESLNGTPFLSNRVRVSFDRNLNDIILHGVQSDPVGKGLINIINAGTLGANNQTSRDVLIPSAGAIACVMFDTTAGTVAGVRVTDPANNSRLVFFGFGFEAVNPGTVPRPGYVGRPEVMQNVLNWLSGVTEVADRADAPNGIPAAFHLSASYPNPWQAGMGAAEAEIRYHLPLDLAAQRVTLRIFDVLGREVATLVDQPYRPGQFSARWNGRDTRGELVSNGVYFYKLQAGALQHVQKQLLVR